MGISMKKEATFSITLEGNEHQIDANTLINTLTHYNNIVKMANAEYGGGTRDVKLKVTALEKGSFDIHLCIESLKNLFSSENVEYLASLVVVIGAVFKTYKHFKGKPVKTEEDNKQVANIVNNEGLVVQTVNIYNTPAVREAVSKSVETANADPNVEGITISSDKFKPEKMERKDFPDLIYKDFDKENIPGEKSVIIEKATLTITALSFTPGGNWKFIYEGFPISLSVKNDGLMKLIDSGERFGKGDAITVKLKINQRFKNDLNTYVNVSYRIEEFLGHIESPKQTKIEFPKE